MCLKSLETSGTKNYMVPTRTGKMRKLFPVREKSRNFKQIGKVSEFYQKYRKWKENNGKIKEKSGKFVSPIMWEP